MTLTAFMRTRTLIRRDRRARQAPAREVPADATPSPLARQARRLILEDRYRERPQLMPREVHEAAVQDAGRAVARAKRDWTQAREDLQTSARTRSGGLCRIALLRLDDEWEARVHALEQAHAAAVTRFQSWLAEQPRAGK